MLGKKQTPASASRRVHPQQRANVFSYHASRSNSNIQRERKVEDTAQAVTSNKFDGRKWLGYAPTIVTSFVILVCLFYISTLNGPVRLQVAGSSSKSQVSAHLDGYVPEVDKVFFDSVYNKSKLLINTTKIESDIEEKYPELGNVAVVLPLIGRRPIVQINPSKPVLLLETNHEDFVLDSHGRAISKASDVDSSLTDSLPVLHDDSGVSLQQGRYALSSSTVKFIEDVHRQLKDKGYKLQNMTLPAGSGGQMYLRLRDVAYYVKFDLEGDSRAQAGTFIATRIKLDNDGVAPKEYIDVRVPGKVYYK